MPDDTPELSPDELAELAAWEGREENASEPLEDTRLRRVNERFRNLPEMQAHSALIDAVHDELNREENLSVEVTVSPAFLRLLGHVETKWAAHEGRAARPLEAVLSQQLNNTLHGMLHSMAVTPTSHPYFREMWNGLCEAEGLAGAKIADPMAPKTQEERGEGPF